MIALGFSSFIEEASPLWNEKLGRTKTSREARDVFGHSLDYHVFSASFVQA